MLLGIRPDRECDTLLRRMRPEPLVELLVPAFSKQVEIELAEIRAARGDRKEADFLRGAVAAIRESEMAAFAWKTGGSCRPARSLTLQAMARRR